VAYFYLFSLDGLLDRPKYGAFPYNFDGMEWTSGAVIALSTGEIEWGWGTPVRSAKPEGFYAPDFGLKEISPWWCFPHQKRGSLAQFLALIPEETGAVAWESAFETEFKSQMEAFQRSALRKVVPYVMVEGVGKGAFKWQALRGATQYAMATGTALYGWWHEGKGMIGATPELLFSMEGTRLLTQAVAGTIRHGEPAHASLEDEHRIVVEAIEAALRPFGRIERGLREERKLRFFSHLVTPLALYSHHPLDFQQCVKALHPTPALGGEPREEALKWLQTVPKGVRGRYGAPFGHSSGCCWVAIRNMQWKGERCQIGVGCGIVKESRWEDEWAELQVKCQSVQHLLTLT